ncbi:MAG: FlgD immunoglobulin-like domain containing protein [Candidatus Kapaibacterium sp.]
MKRLFLLTALAFSLVWTSAYAVSDKDKKGDELDRRSELVMPNPFVNNTSFPEPFDQVGNVNTPGQAAVSTGYYFIDNGDPAINRRPEYEIRDTLVQPDRWTRILPGPRILDSTYWEQNPEEGLRFFRNPAVPGDGDSYFVHGPDNATDSTDNAIAGPIPIGFPFYFNGLRYDSFYVSTNGLISLTNRRYFYDSQGNRTVPSGSETAYDPMSMDWFARARNMAEADVDGDGTLDGPGTGDVADDWGYLQSVLGGNPNNATGGIRGTGAKIVSNAIPADKKSAVIAAFWGDLVMLQHNRNNPGRQFDNGRVYFKRHDANTLIIYFVNAQLKGTVATPAGNTNVAPDRLPGENGYLIADAQIVLDRADSSITVHYQRFNGTVQVGATTVTSDVCFRYNTTAAVSGFARHVNYPDVPQDIEDDADYPWAEEYAQWTHFYSDQTDQRTSDYPNDKLTVKYKQWQNTLRVVDIQYRVRDLDPSSSLDFSRVIPTTQVNNFELLAGEQRIGAIQPVALIQNLTNEIQGPQGVNFVPQELQFNTRFTIVNQATGSIVYSRLVPVDSNCLALPDALAEDCNDEDYSKVRFSDDVSVDNGNYTVNSTKVLPTDNNYNGIPPYGFAQVYFAPWIPNRFFPDHIGRMRAFIISEPFTPEDKESLGDQWPFDDTASVALFVMRRLDNFSDDPLMRINDDATQFHKVGGTDMPSVLRWVNIGTEVVSGTSVSRHPLPPRGRYEAQNFDMAFIESPVIKMNRVDNLNREYVPLGEYGGDELRSFPIDLRHRPGQGKSTLGAVLSISVQRSTNPPDRDWPRGWNDERWLGPEPRVIANGDVYDEWTTGMSVSQKPDYLEVEYATPSPDGIKFIANIPDDNWSVHPNPDPSLPDITDVPALRIFGAGGYQRGFRENDYNYALAEPDPDARELNSLRPDRYDDGIDEEFKKYFVGIPDHWILSPNEGAKNFRFRLKVMATDDFKNFPGANPDDQDDFYVDNITILFPSPEGTDIEVSSVKITWPYTLAPATQATKIPIRVSLSNNTAVDAPSFNLKVKIFKGQPTPNQMSDLNQAEPIYCRTETIPFLKNGSQIERSMPNWNARLHGDGQYRIQAIIIYPPDGDLDPRNDTTYHDVNLTFGDAFAYDPIDDVNNDVDSRQFTGGTDGRGLNLFNIAGNFGGTGSRTTSSGWTPPDVIASGYTGGSGSGSIAAKFVLINQDTVKGYQAHFDNLNQSPDHIAFSIYNGDFVPGQMIAGSELYAQRGKATASANPVFMDFVTYPLPQPVILPPGTYWVVISQLGETGIELSAAKERVGLRVTNVSFPPIGTGPLGQSGVHLILDKNLRQLERRSGVMKPVNNNVFAYSNTRGSGQWNPFMPTEGNPAYAHNDHYGKTAYPPGDGQTMTLGRGTWIPLIRPYLGEKASGYSDESQICPDDIPVEIAFFEYDTRQDGIDLIWQTQMEENNLGFYIERRVTGNDEWQSIGFVDGHGNSNVAIDYSYTDKNVTINTTYEYRLRQVDFSGVHSCDASKTIKVTFDKVGELTVLPNTLNPVSTATDFRFNLPQKSSVNIEIVDMFGNVVKTFNKDMNAGYNQVGWDVTDDAGAKVSTGSYVVRITAGGEVASRKFTVVR